MDFLPKDPAILVSSVNMLLRDKEFDTLEALCYAFSRDPKQIKDTSTREVLSGVSNRNSSGPSATTNEYPRQHRDRI